MSCKRLHLDMLKAKKDQRKSIPFFAQWVLNLSFPYLLLLIKEL